MFSQERLQPEQSARRRKRLLTDILKANYVKKIGWSLKMVLIKSSIILILTVASISSDNLSKRVRHFETLHSSHLSHTIVKRGLDPEGTHKFNKIREVGFRTLGRDFRLILSPKRDYFIQISRSVFFHNFRYLGPWSRVIVYCSKHTKLSFFQNDTLFANLSLHKYHFFAQGN